ncbi:hypothetical protein PPL_06395 [Heterostelium album PN500]|uniref:Uncharacterized protein n=1 Tax=Heterostelium pallidum (strain ATCC 26659 / Pp 5 / PN500) TaxID=670386 RepID=D3BD15_HETP5|nr:hypothetical protein PPL_06395 [Heterostelium album PN500]EFA80807.1 hypothetical protein PPL_06395 [Heterostelium album PN500]|eukprot:XP_020432926.1 hypothetical protein PPL_06395 [Heterostelium album PN500]
MTTKEILDKQKIYNQDELNYMKRDDLWFLKKVMLIDAIIKRQEHLKDLKSKLVTDNSIEKYHRGTVEYRLPKLIISRIIRDLWHDDIDVILNTNQLCSNYRWLLSIGLVSKELYKLISSLFTRFNVFSTKTTIHIQLAASPYETLAQQLKNSVINPFSVLKNIKHLTMSMAIFRQLTDKTTTTCTTEEIELIFKSVTNLKLTHARDMPFQMQHCKSIKKYMPNLDSLTFYQIKLDAIRIYEMLQQIPQLTSLDISTVQLNKMPTVSHIFSSSIRKLKLPKLLARIPNILGENTQLTTLSVDSTNSNRATGYAHIKSKHRPFTNSRGTIKRYAKKIYDATENHIENQTIEETYPNLNLHVLNLHLSVDEQQNKVVARSWKDLDSNQI